MPGVECSRRHGGGLAAAARGRAAGSAAGVRRRAIDRDPVVGGRWGRWAPSLELSVMATVASASAPCQWLLCQRTLLPLAAVTTIHA